MLPLLVVIELILFFFLNFERIFRFAYLLATGKFKKEKLVVEKLENKIVDEYISPFLNWWLDQNLIQLSK